MPNKKEARRQKKAKALFPWCPLFGAPRVPSSLFTGLPRFARHTAAQRALRALTLRPARCPDLFCQAHPVVFADLSFLVLAAACSAAVLLFTTHPSVFSLSLTVALLPSFLQSNHGHTNQQEAEGWFL